MVCLEGQLPGVRSLWQEYNSWSTAVWCWYHGNHWPLPHRSCQWSSGGNQDEVSGCD